MATYKATIQIPNGATFVNDSQIGFVTLGAGYQMSYSPVTASSASDLVNTIGLYYTLVFGYGGTWTYTNVGEIFTITWVDPTVDFINTPIYGNTFAFTSDTDTTANYGFGTLNIVQDCPTETIVCPTCYEINKSACEDSYTFVAGLTPSTVYYVVIENNRNKQYVQQVTTDGSGDFSIDATAPEFPIGFFIPEQFKYTIKVYSNSTLMNQEDITIGSTIYTCITLGFVNTVTTTASANFGVDFLIDDELNFIVDDLGNTFSV